VLRHQYDGQSELHVLNKNGQVKIYSIK